MTLPANFHTHMLKASGWKRTALGAVAGTALAEFENRSLMEGQQGHGLDRINDGIGAVTGGMIASGNPQLVLGGLGGLGLKQMQLMQTNQLKRFTDLQIPVAKTNLDTARIANDTAKTVSDQAKQWKPSDVAQLGMAGAGAAGAAGLGYYLYKTLGAGKPKPVPKIRLNMPTPRGGSAEVEMDNTPESLSKQLYDSLRRDAKRKLRAEARDGIWKDHHAPAEKSAGHLVHEPTLTTAARLSYLVELSELI